jgi:hypothetical protein
VVGSSLIGDTAVRYIYVDEAGTSAHEPVTVVVGIIVDADRDWLTAEAELAELRKLVPEKYRRDFIFHAKALWGDKRLRDGWSFEERRSLIVSVGQIARKLNLTVTVGKVRRDAGGAEVLKAYKLPHTLPEWHHLQSFGLCVARADAYIREECGEREIATLVVEDIPEMRSALRGNLKVLSKLVFNPPFDPFRPTRAERAGGRRDQRIYTGIFRIRDGINFASKADAPLLQIADAWAFVFRRFCSAQSGGADMLKELLGHSLLLEDWEGPVSQAIFEPFPLGMITAFQNN